MATARRAGAPARPSRRDEFMRIGLELFSQRSFDAASIDEIAARAGISKGLLYHYFPSKRDFYLAVVRAAADRLLQASTPDPDLPPDQRGEAALDRYLDAVEAHADAYAMILRGGLAADPEVAAILDETRDAFVRRVSRRIDGREPAGARRVSLRGWVGLVEAACLEWVRRREIERSELRDLLAATLESALAAAARADDRA